MKIEYLGQTERQTLGETNDIRYGMVIRSSGHSVINWFYDIDNLPRKQRL